MIIKTAVHLLLAVILCFFTTSCQPNKASADNNFKGLLEGYSSKVETIDSTNYHYTWLTNYNFREALINLVATPTSYKRVGSSINSFGAWLQHLPIKTSDNTVYLYNGSKKRNQNAQHKVINIDVGNKDLQQCADAVMRLRAEYLFASKQLSKIKFNYTSGAAIAFSKWCSGYFPKVKGDKVVWVASQNDASYVSFKKYMNNIFTYAGTSSLSKELKSVNISDMQIGDVFIYGGFPGHAVIVVDLAIKAKTGDKCFMIAQSYMPAQNIHVLKNPLNNELSPWYSIEACKDKIITPEWTFESNQLKRFE